jgi:hypothetical protein
VTERNPKPPPPSVGRALPRHCPSGPQISREVARKATAWPSSFSSRAGRGGRDSSALSARLAGSGCPPAAAGGVASRSGGALAGSGDCTERALRLVTGWLLLEWQRRGLTTADVAGAALRRGHGWHGPLFAVALPGEVVGERRVDRALLSTLLRLRGARDGGGCDGCWLCQAAVHQWLSTRSFFIDVAGLASPCLVLVAAPWWCFRLRWAPSDGGIAEVAGSWLLP